MAGRLTRARWFRTAALCLVGLPALAGCQSATADRNAGTSVSDPPGPPVAETAAEDSAAGLAAADSLARAREDSIARNPEISFKHDGRMRRADVHLPPGSDTVTSLPVVLAFHGGGGSASGFRDYIRLDAFADMAGFIAVYPDGTGPVGGRLLTWNAGWCCGYASDQEVDDVGFVIELLDELNDRWPVDPGRVYATGFSNGAMFVYRLAAEVPARFAAIAPVAGVGRAAPSPTGLPVPVIHFHSVDDLRALYEGGLGPPFPLTDRRVEHEAVEPVIQRWASHDGCLSSPEVRVRIQSIENPADASQGATRIAYRACSRGSEVVLWRLTGAGHVWPGAGTLPIQRFLGPPSGIVDANVEMWAFFERHRRGVAAPARTSVEDREGD